MHRTRSTARRLVVAARAAALSLALSLALIGAVISGPASAEADGPDHYRVVNVAADDLLNVRIEPDASAAILGTIAPNADCLRNLGCQGGLTLIEFETMTEAERAARLKANPRWCKIEYQDLVGWVNGHFLAEGACN